MKNSYSLILIFLMLIAAGTSYGQGYAFRVLANKGENKVKKGSETTVLKTGATLNATDELVVATGSYIGLMHNTGKTLEIREAGTLKVTDLEKKIAANNVSVAGKYAQYIAAKVNDDGTRTTAQRTNATGAISRATGSNAIGVMLPSGNNSINVLGENAIVRWNAPKDAPESIVYVVTIMNIFDEVIYQEETSKTMVNLNFAEIPNDMPLYIFNVQQKGNKEISSANYGIKKVTPGDMTEVEENYKGLQEAVTDDSPLNKVIYASFFEENGLLLDALTKYEEAIQMSPDVNDYSVMYMDFLKANGLAE